MKVHVISCQIFEPYINELMKQGKIDTDFTVSYEEIDSHNEPVQLKQILQDRINEVENVDLIVLLYGICGNSTKGIKANKIPIMIPKVHDCATLLLGGKEEYLTHFGNRPSQGWNSIAYKKNDIHDVAIETHPKYLEFLEKYGEDNALYLMEMMYPVSDNIVYISLGLKEDENYIQQLEPDTEIIKGDIRYILNVLNLKSKEVLVLNPDEELVPVYDMDTVMTKK